MAKVLIVDDESTITRVLSELLSKENHTCLTSNHGLDGFKAAISEEVDLVITDVRMPHWSGRDLAGALEMIRKKVPVIVVTGFSDDEITKEINELPNVVAVINKPWNNDELVELVKKHTS